MDKTTWKTPLSEKIKELSKEGFDCNFKVSDKGLLICNNLKYQPEEVTLEHEFRFEGVSNPSDMSILYALKTNDGKKGTLVNSYGTYADEKVDSFVNKIGR